MFDFVILKKLHGNFLQFSDMKKWIKEKKVADVCESINIFPNIGQNLGKTQPNGTSKQRTYPTYFLQNNSFFQF